MCYGLFDWLVFFGHINISGVFIYVFYWFFKDLLDQGVVVFLKNVLIYSNIALQHLGLLMKVLHRL